MVSPGLTPAFDEPAIASLASAISAAVANLIFTLSPSPSGNFHQDGAAKSMLELDAFEEALRDQSNRRHDEAPEPRHVNNFAALKICRIDKVGRAGGRNREQRALAPPGH